MDGDNDKERLQNGLIKLTDGEYSYVRCDGLVDIIAATASASPGTQQNELDAWVKTNKVVDKVFGRVLDETSETLADVISAREKELASRVIEGLVMVCEGCREMVVTPAHLRAILALVRAPHVASRLAALDLLAAILLYAPQKAQQLFMDTKGIAVVVDLLKDSAASRRCRTKAAEFLGLCMTQVNPAEAADGGRSLWPQVGEDSSTYYRDNVARSLGVGLTLEILSSYSGAGGGSGGGGANSRGGGDGHGDIEKGGIENVLSIIDHTQTSLVVRP